MASGGSEAFDKYAKFGKTESQLKEAKGLRIEQKNIVKMMKETGVIDGKYPSQLLDNDMARVLGKLTQSDTANYPKGKKDFEKKGFDALLHQVAETKKCDYNDIVSKINSSSGPSTAGTTGVANASNVSRMTDTSNYTGSHKERFDESGKGKGADGRTDKADNSGYVGNYKGEGSYDKKH